MLKKPCGHKKTDTLQGWRKGGITKLSMSQTSLTNWSAGGQNSFSINGLFSAYANYRKNKAAWDNSLDIGYGLLRQDKNSGLMKTDDKFDLLSKYGQQVYKSWYYPALFNFKTPLVYDDDIKVGIDTNKDGIVDKFGGPKIQFKEILGVGIACKF